MKNLRVFALNATKTFGEKVAAHLGIELSNHDERYFSDGEVYCASLENVRGKDVFVIQSLYGDEKESVNDKLMKLLVFIGSLKDASAERIVAVIPYMCYARQDRKIRPRNPISTKYIAKILESVGTSRILALDVHNPTSIQNCYLCAVDLLEANVLFENYIANSDIVKDEITLMSPDAGGLARVRKFRAMLENVLEEKVGLACLDKIHDGDLIQANDIMGVVNNKTVIILDDMISSGSTISQCIEASLKKGAKNAYAFATHGLFVGDCEKHLMHRKLNKIVITDTVKPFRLSEELKTKVEVVETAELFSKAIAHIHNNESLSELLSRRN